ncbi:hypothetical protein [Methylobacterium sp. B1]|uniref:hypothetical protein n=1 Tax=Methylobacterium sp. B1 TaxID=91459 RepID=UPI0003462409|nr:hypothetical protein [Methylobacterium sp. B1]
MDLKSTEAKAATIASNAAKSALRYAWTWTAVHPRTACVISLGLIAAAFVGGLLVGAR